MMRSLTLAGFFGAASAEIMFATAHQPEVEMEASIADAGDAAEGKGGTDTTITKTTEADGTRVLEIVAQTGTGKYDADITNSTVPGEKAIATGTIGASAQGKGSTELETEAVNTPNYNAHGVSSYETGKSSLTWTFCVDKDGNEYKVPADEDCSTGSITADAANPDVHYPPRSRSRLQVMQAEMRLAQAQVELAEHELALAQMEESLHRV